MEYHDLAAKYFLFSRKCGDLSGVTTYIERHHHLPDIPSADSVARNGVNLGSNQAQLLRKIEELTLYTIDQQKQLKELKQQNREMGEQNKEMGHQFKKMQDQLDKLTKVISKKN